MDKPLLYIITHGLTIIPAVAITVIILAISLIFMYLSKGSRARWVYMVITNLALISTLLSVTVAIKWKINSDPIPPVQIRITSPSDSQSVDRTQTIQGTVNEGDVKVYVLVKPLRSAIWWVQPDAAVMKKGDQYVWESPAYFGTMNVGAGEKFEVVAIATKEGEISREFRGINLKEGEMLATLPPYKNVSNLIIVQRRD